jgi:DNA-binding HxlR family transcriptional regulator
MSETSDDCGFATAVKVIGGKWKIDILCQLTVAPRRFGRLRQLVRGISEKVLMHQLREMERDGIVSRKVYLQSPPKVVYALTEQGAALNAAATILCRWGEQHSRPTRAAPLAERLAERIA